MEQPAEVVAPQILVQNAALQIPIRNAAPQIPDPNEVAFQCMFTVTEGTPEQKSEACTKLIKAQIQFKNMEI